MPVDPVINRLWEIVWKSQLAVMLDIVTPKPGNVHRYHDHPDTRLVHFTASIARLCQPLFQAAQRGTELQAKQPPSTAGLGELVKLATHATMSPHGKNTLLGTVLLIVPLAVAAGQEAPSPHFTPHQLRSRLTTLLETTTVDDAIELVHALQIAKPGGGTPQSPQWTPQHEALDYQSPKTIPKLRKEGYTLRTYMALAAPYDAVAQEYATNFAYIFDTLHPRLVHALNRYATEESAILSTYMWALSQRPDTFIQRKAGPATAEDVQRQAHTLYLKMRDTKESQWTALLSSFDQHLHSQGSRLNPGTTTDLLSAAIYIALLVENLALIL